MAVWRGSSMCHWTGVIRKIISSTKLSSFFQHDPQFSLWEQAKQREEPNHGGGGNGDNNTDGDVEDNGNALVGAHQQEAEKTLSQTTQASEIFTIWAGEILSGGPSPYQVLLLHFIDETFIFRPSTLSEEKFYYPVRTSEEDSSRSSFDNDIYDWDQNLILRHSSPFAVPEDSFLPHTTQLNQEGNMSSTVQYDSRDERNIS